MWFLSPTGFCRYTITFIVNLNKSKLESHVIYAKVQTNVWNRNIWFIPCIYMKLMVPKCHLDHVPPWSKALQCLPIVYWMKSQLLTPGPPQFSVRPTPPPEPPCCLSHAMPLPESFLYFWVRIYPSKSSSGVISSKKPSLFDLSSS